MTIEQIVQQLQTAESEGLIKRFSAHVYTSNSSAWPIRTHVLWIELNASRPPSQYQNMLDFFHKHKLRAEAVSQHEIAVYYKPKIR